MTKNTTALLLETLSQVGTPTADPPDEALPDEAPKRLDKFPRYLCDAGPWYQRQDWPTRTEISVGGRREGGPSDGTQSVKCLRSTAAFESVSSFRVLSRTSSLKLSCRQQRPKPESGAQLEKLRECGEFPRGAGLGTALSLWVGGFRGRLRTGRKSQNGLERPSRSILRLWDSGGERKREELQDVPQFQYPWCARWWIKRASERIWRSKASTFY